MRIGVLADAHGNADGLRLCLDFLRSRGAERILFLGDAIGYFHRAAEVCAMLDAAHALIIQGNHEAIFSGSLEMRPEARPVIAHPPQDDPVVRRWARRCAGIGPAREILLGGQRILMVHAGPADPLQERVARPEDVRAGGHGIVLMGHSHRPILGRTADGALALNPGSCGQPRDHGALLSLAVLETDGPHAEIFRLPFVHDAELLRRAHPDVRRVAARRERPLGILAEAECGNCASL